MNRRRAIARVTAATLVTVCWCATALATGLTREQALQGLTDPDAATRIAAVERLGEIGRAADADRLLVSLADADADVRAVATDAIWQLWSRSGDAAIDRLLARGVERMQGADFDGALALFNEIVTRKPAFAEGWNKRATVYFLMGEHEKSLRDCDEVFKRNPNHFGALSGAGQIHLQLGHLPQALEFFRRALQVNPNLDHLRQAIPLIERRLRTPDGLRT